MCSPLASMPNIYKFDHPILLSKLISLLNGKKYTILKQILNFQSKVIGLFVKKEDVSCYIPCYPAALDPTYPDFIFMNDPQIYNNYDTTIRFLTTLYKETKGAIPIKPEFKIVEDEHIVGIITQSNQFIQLSEPILVLDVNDRIPVINNSNYIVDKSKLPMVSADTEIQTSDKYDTERISYVKKIKLETNFYNAFRNTIRILLNDYENIKLRERIEELINIPYILYSTKLHDTISLLKEITGDSIVFADKYDHTLIDSISTCITMPKNKCVKNPICALIKNDKCQLIIPKHNLITPQNDNELVYYGKMADELIRYSRIKSFIFQPQTYLSFDKIGYNLRDDEIIIIQSLLTKDYFDGLQPETKNAFVKYNTYDNTEPIITQVYENKVDIDNTIQLVEEVRKCIPTETNISSKIWKHNFPSNFKELYYDKADCGFYLLIDIIQKFSKKTLTINDIKHELLEEYQKYFEHYGQQIIDILILEGKKTQGTRVKQKTISFQHFIYSDDYFITNLDLYVILVKHKIPSIIISSKPIILTNKQTIELVLYGSQEDNFVFIYSPALRAETIPKYSIIETNSIIFYPLSIINEESRNTIIRSIETGNNIEQVLRSFTKKSVKLHIDKDIKKPKKLKLKIVDEEVVNEEKEEKEEKEVVDAKRERGILDELEENSDSKELLFPELSKEERQDQNELDIEDKDEDKDKDKDKTRKQKTYIVLKKPKTKKRKFKIIGEL